ncbi:putative phosphoglycerate mutase family protein [Lactobacillus pasteurii DSM 23907 = CRBIP 24.76]|uniref:Phosphoglycerate mutase n=1 Tax=Lactobacillus pasteurii DSM 23907 = CRBIP 24.76 TaxID=1423790 RepID=I7LD78_9LACO|nr:histidine phosphatase family protein [Lactobacillus pasteurii]KRK07649.1 putative phosphoglycerate mutase family protein [Lactobacillus pasteurii DSM 23907 = CRBIP 24.76]TDG77170.1 hypothetical protein C5L33_000363 [Lactobacillus pasteurii]CCI84653.1 Phosphoglycerate mutase [Lactobacillus pasteurii DSM 23907 = CRBIP 24.76]
MIDLYLVRHGQTYFNYYHKIQGWCDSPLTPLGIKQAKASSDYLKKSGIKFDYAFASTAERASDTLEIIADMPYQRVKGLREFSFGRFEGQDEFLNPKLPYGDFFKQYGGESQTEVEERLYKTITDLLQDIPDGKKVLIVSHGGALMNFLRRALGVDKPLGDKHYGNCAVAHVTYDGQKYSLLDVAEPAKDVE